MANAEGRISIAPAIFVSEVEAPRPYFFNITVALKETTQETPLSFSIECVEKEGKMCLDPDWFNITPKNVVLGGDKTHQKLRVKVQFPKEAQNGDYEGVLAITPGKPNIIEGQMSLVFSTGAVVQIRKTGNIGRFDQARYWTADLFSSVSTALSDKLGLDPKTFFFTTLGVSMIIGIPKGVSVIKRRRGVK